MLARVGPNSTINKNLCLRYFLQYFSTHNSSTNRYIYIHNRRDEYFIYILHIHSINRITLRNLALGLR